MSEAIQIGETVRPIRGNDEAMTVNRFGLANASVKWSCIWSRLMTVLNENLYYNAPHPDFPNLLIQDRQVAREPGNIATITAQYQGPTFAEGSGALPGPEYNSDISMSSEPIETNAFFQDLTAVQLRQVQQWFENVGANSTITAFPGDWVKLQKLLAGKKLKGQTNYLRPGIIHSIDYVSYSRPLSLVSRIGLVQTSVTNGPTLPSGQNWLFTSLTWKLAGAIYSVNEKYQASGPGGWDPDFYKSATSNSNTFNPPF